MPGPESGGLTGCRCGPEAGAPRVEFHGIEPPFSLSHPEAADGTRQLDDLEPNLKRAINEKLEEDGVTSEVDFTAPIAPARLGASRSSPSAS